MDEEKSPQQLLGTIGTYRELRDWVNAHGAPAAIPAIRRRLSRFLVGSFAQEHNISLDKARRLLGMTGTGKAGSEGLLSQGESERLVRFAEIEAVAIETLGDEATARRWLEAKNLTLNGEAPYEMLDTGYGAGSVRALLGAIRYGGAA
ncbi:MAG: MbcA/ParS/Xre antitoxin family protein [Pseudohongiellaceae bacterium]